MTAIRSPEGPLMSVVYSLYDALVSIKVPDEKAKAVIDAMEREMMNKLATKADLEHLQLTTKADLEHLQAATRADLEHLQVATRADLEHLRLTTKADLAHTREILSKDIQNLSNALTLKFGAMTAGALILTCTILGTMIVLR
jgi:hypothetical protein